MKKVELFDSSGEPLIVLGAEGGLDDNVIPRLYVSSPNLTVVGDEIHPLDASKNTVSVDYKFVSTTIAFTDKGKISIQGNTSVLAPKKGFTLDFENKHRFKDWLAFDSFHCKGYYTDWMHCRDIISNRLLEQMYLSKPIDVRRPYTHANDFGGDYRTRIECGARCHIDGFPVELYVNDNYWGLYSINIKKSRDNYFLGKKNVDHIQIETSNWCMLNNSFSWAKLEIRNPKSDSGNTEFVEGVEPNNGEVKTAVTALMAFFNSITNGSSKEAIEQYLVSDTLVDAIVFYQFLHIWDCFGNNGLFTTWNGSRWALCLYDFDLSFGHEVGSAPGGYPTGDTIMPADTNTFSRGVSGPNAYTYAPWLSSFEQIYADEIAERYAYYRKMGVFTADNVVRLFDEWTREVGEGVYTRDLKRWSYPSYAIGDGTMRIYEWMTERIAYLDSKYGFVE